MKRIFPLLFLLPLLLWTAAACGEDRSGEQPFAPEVRTLDAESDGPQAVLRGAVLSSPNSHLLECGFAYGNDTLRLNVVADSARYEFEARTDSLRPGNYFAVAYSKNGVGTSFGDTVRFSIRNEEL